VPVSWNEVGVTFVAVTAPMFGDTVTVMPDVKFDPDTTID
jgi:hypothetical protein